MFARSCKRGINNFVSYKHLRRSARRRQRCPCRNAKRIS